MINLINNYGGEMLPEERKLLFNWILSYRPKNILEIGTGEGGGGCYYMASALKINNHGNIYTCDPCRGPNQNFLDEFSNVLFHNVGSNDLIKKIIDQKIDIDFIFFDGPEDPQLAYDDILKLEQIIKPGTKFVMHDWELFKRVADGLTSIKSKYIRPYIEHSNKWKLLYQTENSIESVGLCLYEFLGS